MARRPISHRDFVRDLARGTEGEEIVEEFLLEEFGLVSENVSQNNPDFDILITGVCTKWAKSKGVVSKKLFKKILKDGFGFRNKNELSVEVKYDQAASRSGNIFIELFFDITEGKPGTVFKCKADIVCWVIPRARKKKSIYLFKRAEMLAWLFEYMRENKIKLKTPGVSPYARGMAVPVKEIADGFACLGEYTFRY